MANSNNMSGDEMQAKIQTARRDAEGLKDRIKRKKAELEDTSRKLILNPRIPRDSSASSPSHLGMMRLVADRSSIEC